MMNNFYVRVIFGTFIQQSCVGVVSAGVMTQNWPVVFIGAALTNAAWWFNIGTRIDAHHGERRMLGAVYALTAGLSVTFGAYCVQHFTR